MGIALPHGIGALATDVINIGERKHRQHAEGDENQNAQPIFRRHSKNEGSDAGEQEQEAC